ncbi:ABC transporter permease [Frankia sp. CcI49]|uniref:carbohydrate ABC transporter permease n=1 Tax=unclassified Frankia TaxID=2632575 RepID=UPI0006CA0B29|nr:MULTISPECIES: carbohydrate ABC transporter permease [unclassified Frankia]KPM56348.1 ABC transporter permease [Frankia sp. R43]ONH52547.1 ABC transporter permease [Frankia sp. CcI49]
MPWARTGAAARHVAVLTVIVGLLFPLFWVAITSLRPANDLFSTSPVPWPMSAENYRDALLRFPIGMMLLNTLIMALGATLLQVVVAIGAAYAVVRFRPRWGGAVVLLAGAALVIPPQTLIIPQFLAASHLGWRNSYLGLIIPQLAACGLPILLLREYLAAIPTSLIEASVMDGARPAETLRLVVLPLLRPALAAVSILVFINTWNEYLWPTLIAPQANRTTIQAGLQLLGNQEGPPSGALLAAAIITTLPVLAVYAVASRRITNAFLQSGIK